MTLHANGLPKLSVCHQIASPLSQVVQGAGACGQGLSRLLPWPLLRPREAALRPLMLGLVLPAAGLIHTRTFLDTLQRLQMVF